MVSFEERKHSHVQIQRHRLQIYTNRLANCAYGFNNSFRRFSDCEFISWHEISASVYFEISM